MSKRLERFKNPDNFTKNDECEYGSLVLKITPVKETCGQHIKLIEVYKRREEELEKINNTSITVDHFASENTLEVTIGRFQFHNATDDQTQDKFEIRILTAIRKLYHAATVIKFDPRVRWRSGRDEVSSIRIMNRLNLYQKGVMKQRHGGDVILSLTIPNSER